MAIPIHRHITLLLLSPLTALAIAAGEGGCVADAATEQAAVAADQPMGLLVFVFVLAIFLGFELISKVPSQLHTPLMSGSNAISGITVVGALLAAGGGRETLTVVLGTLAVAFATINVVGGYLVTDRMLAMFSCRSERKGDERKGDGA